MTDDGAWSGKAYLPFEENLMAGGKDIPKNHHFVAQMHAERFTDPSGKLWAFNKTSKNLGSVSV